jgi:hypothetical protein
MDDYRVVDADVDRSCEAVVRVWGRSIGWPDRPAEMYQRYYQQDLVERPRLKLLCHVPSGQVVGTMGVSPRRVMWHRREIKAGTISHFCVAREHRKVRPAMLLFKEVVDACRGHCELVYGMPRTDGAIAFCRLVHLRPVSFVQRRIRVLRHGHYLERFLPRPLAGVAGGIVDATAAARHVTHGRSDMLAADWADRVDPRMAALWEMAHAGDGWNAVRDEALLRWRFDHLLAVRRRYLLLSDKGARDRLVAWFACDTSSFDPEVLVVQDFWSGQGLEPIDRRMVRALCREAHALGFAGVETHLAAPDACHLPWRAEGFVERNRFPVFMHWLDPARNGDGEGSFHMTEFDNDG